MKIGGLGHRRRHLVRAVGIAATLAALPSRLPAADPAAIDALMVRQMAANHVPGAALALIEAGRIVLEKGYGIRDRETAAPVTPATLFNIGSISKSFTALGVAQLVDEQRLDLDAPVVRYLPDLRLSDAEAARAVTLRQLLSHTSGLPADGQWPRQVPATRQGIVDEFARMPITAPPGARFQYCSRCIVLAAVVIERITGLSWEEYTRARIFQPLGMGAASFGPRGLEQAADRARPYQYDAVRGEVPVPWSRLAYLDPLGPAGAIDADVDELARYALLHLGNGAVAGTRLVSASMMAVLHQPEVAVGGDWSPTARDEDRHYALGVVHCRPRRAPYLPQRRQSRLPGDDPTGAIGAGRRRAAVERGIRALHRRRRPRPFPAASALAAARHAGSG